MVEGRARPTCERAGGRGEDASASAAGGGRVRGFGTGGVRPGVCVDAVRGISEEESERGAGRGLYGLRVLAAEAGWIQRGLRAGGDGEGVYHVGGVSEPFSEWGGKSQPGRGGREAEWRTECNGGCDAQTLLQAGVTVKVGGGVRIMSDATGRDGESAAICESRSRHFFERESHSGRGTRK